MIESGRREPATHVEAQIAAEHSEIRSEQGRGPWFDVDEFQLERG